MASFSFDIGARPPSTLRSPAGPSGAIAPPSYSSPVHTAPHSSYSTPVTALTAVSDDQVTPSDRSPDRAADADMEHQNVIVAVRVRPANEREIAFGGGEIRV